MERGELSYSKARELTRIGNAANEDFLLMVARHGTAQHVERMVRHFRHAKEAEELSREARQQANRSVRYWWDHDGSLVLRARLPAETGALVLKALDIAIDEVDIEVDAREAANEIPLAPKARPEPASDRVDFSVYREPRPKPTVDSVDSEDLDSDDLDPDEDPEYFDLDEDAFEDPDFEPDGSHENVPAGTCLTSTEGVGFGDLDPEEDPDAGPKNVPPGTSLPPSVPARYHERDSVQRMLQREPFAKRRADALGRLAEGFMAHGSASFNGGDKHQIVIHVDHETLVTSTAGRCGLEHGPAMAAETARRLACDASRVTIVETDKGEPLNVGRKTRSLPPALQRALNSRDQGCRFPGCANQHFVDAHHIQHWAHGGETKLSNLVTLCRFHHRAVHEGGVQIVILDDGALRFVKPDGTSLDTDVLLHGSADDLVEQHRNLGLAIDARTAATRWGGETMERDGARRAVFAGTSDRAVKAERLLGRIVEGRGDLAMLL